MEEEDNSIQSPPSTKSTNKRKRTKEFEEENLTEEVFEELFKSTPIPPEKRNEIYSILSENYLTTKGVLKIIIEGDWKDVSIPLLAKQILKNWVEKGEAGGSKKSRTIAPKREPLPVIDTPLPSVINEHSIKIVWIQKNAQRNSRIEWRDFQKVKKKKNGPTFLEWRSKVQLLSSIPPESLIKNTNNPFPRLVSLPDEACSAQLFVKEQTVSLKGNQVEVNNNEADFFDFEICESSFDKEINDHKSWTLVFHIYDEVNTVIAIVESQAIKVYSDFKQHPCEIKEIIPSATIVNQQQKFVIKGNFRADDSLKLYCNDIEMEFTKIGCGCIAIEYISAIPEVVTIFLRYNGKRSNPIAIKFYDAGVDLSSLNETIELPSVELLGNSPISQHVEITSEGEDIEVDTVETPPNDPRISEESLRSESESVDWEEEVSTSDIALKLEKRIEQLQTQHQYNLEEVLKWEQTLKNISNALQSLTGFPKATKQLLEKAQKNILELKQKKYVVTFAGKQGQGKSEVVNKLAAPEQWLKNYGLNSSVIGKFPLKSKKGGSSITQIQHRLCFDEDFGYELKFCSEEEFTERLKIISKKFVYPLHSNERRSITPQEISIILKNLNEKYHNDSAEGIALSEIVLYGPWAFEKDFEIVDTPGFGHDKLQDHILKKLLNSSTIVATVNARNTIIDDIKSLMIAGAFRNPPDGTSRILISFYAADDDENEFIQNGKNSEILKNNLSACAFDKSIPAPGTESENLYIRRQFFARLAKGRTERL